MTPLPWWQHANAVAFLLITVGLLFGIIRVDFAWPLS